MEYKLEKGRTEDIVAERLLAEIVFLGAQFLNYSGTCIYIVSTQLLTNGGYSQFIGFPMPSTFNLAKLTHPYQTASSLESPVYGR